MSNTRNTTIRHAPRVPGTGPIVNSAISAVAGAVLALAAVGAWDAYDTNSADKPSVASSTGVTEGLRRGHVDSDPSVSYRDAQPVASESVRVSRSGHFDSDPSVNLRETAAAPATRDVRRSSVVPTGHVDSDPGVSYAPAAIQPASAPGVLARGHVDSDPSISYAEAAIQPSTREFRRSGAVSTGHVDSDPSVTYAATVERTPAVAPSPLYRRGGQVFSE